MKLPRLTGFALALLGLAGCAGYTICDEGSHRTVLIENSSWYLFDLVPIVSGNPLYPNEFGTRWFTETTTLENNLKMLDAAIAETGADGYRALKSESSDESLFIILMQRRVLRTSAELVIPDPAATDTAPKNESP